MKTNGLTARKMREMENLVEDFELQIAVPQLAWLTECGGPVVAAKEGGNSGEIQINGVVFTWFTLPSWDGNRDLSHHLENGGDDAGWISLSPGHGNKINWSRYKILEERGTTTGKNESLTLHAGGCCSCLHDAVNEALAWKFEKQERAGFSWHMCADETWNARQWGDSLGVRKVDRENSGGMTWLWSRRPQNIKQLMELMSSYELSGWAETCEQAMLDAAQSVNKVLDQCRVLTLTQADLDKYQEGKKAGRAELLADINTLCLGEKQ